MFVGSINADLRSILAGLAPAWRGLPAYIGCSSNFTVERILAAQGLVLLAEIMAENKQESSCRVASASCPAEALTRSGQGDFHHPALPAIRLASLIPRS
jgi:hypothetical protein